MKPTTIENLIADQLFKLNKSDETISNYILDCGSLLTCKESESIFDGTNLRLESKIKAILGEWLNL